MADKIPIESDAPASASPPAPAWRGVWHRHGVVLALPLLLVLGVVAWTRPTQGDAQPYHAAVREAVEAIPRTFGVWQGRDFETPPEAVKLLQPNIILTRQYVNTHTGELATLLIVHCKNARDLSGHYPPVCYPNAGWNFAAQPQPQIWTIHGRTIPGYAYPFVLSRSLHPVHTTVLNFLIVPGAFVSDMEAVREAGGDQSRYFYGGAQVQLLVDSSITPERRDQLMREIVGQRDVWRALQTIATEPGSVAPPETITSSDGV